jgi:hypothetical protein
MTAYQDTIDELLRRNFIRAEWIPRQQRHNSLAYPKSRRVRIPRATSPETTVVGLEEVGHVLNHRDWQYLPLLDARGRR